MRPLVSKVSMVTNSWRVGVIHAHLVSKVSMVTGFFGGDILIGYDL